MVVAVDATMFMLMLRPETPIRTGPKGVPIPDAKERIEKLVADLGKARTKIVIPTPALSEALVRAGAAASQAIVDGLQRHAVFQVQPFDARAAIELAAMTRDAVAKGRKKDEKITWAKLKFDRQIVAIAKVVGATTIYSDDKDMRAIGREAKIEVVGIADLSAPPESRQGNLLDRLKTAGDENTGIKGDKDEASTDDAPGRS
jgi:predicted nucleic acid-binding protein